MASWEVCSHSCRFVLLLLLLLLLLVLLLVLLLLQLFLLILLPPPQYLASPIIGSLSDKHGRKPLLLLSTVGRVIMITVATPDLASTPAPLLLPPRYRPLLPSLGFLHKLHNIRLGQDSGGRFQRSDNFLWHHNNSPSITPHSHITSRHSC